MKIKERYKLLNHAQEDYSKIFGCDYKFKKLMIVKDLIGKKDYDCIEWYIASPKGWHKPDMFFGICESVNGELISLDGDSYSENEVILSYSEWSVEELDIKNGLTVVVRSK